MIKISAFGRVASQLFNLKHGNTPILLKKSISFGWQSLASILSDPIDINDEDVLFLKDWEKNVVLSEFKKDVFEELKNSQGEFFVFDFLNERFNLIRYNDSYITSTHISKKLQCLINENVEIVYRNIFYKKNKSVIEDIMVQFSKKISEIYNPSHIIMIKAFLCEQYKDKNGNIVPFDDIDKIHKTNSMLEDMYIFMENCIPNINIIETPKNVMAEELHVSNLSSTTYSEEYLNMVYKKTENICTSISLAKINENLSAYCNNTFTTSIQSLNFYKQKYPYQDYILFYGEKGIKERLCNFAKSIGLYFYEFNTRVDIGVFLLSSRPVKFFRGKVFAFSGITKNNGKLIFGDEDIIDAIDNYTNEIGEYTLIIENENHVDIINDYFGISKTFYYNKNKLAIMSNRYHLLLLLLKNLNITLKLKFDQCAFYLTLDKVYSQQAFFRDLPIKDTYILPIDQSIRIVKTEKNLLFLKTKLHNVLHNPKTFNKHDYTFKLQQAADEILENVKIILQDNRFDYSIIDLTGGMDSRLVYSAITHFPEYKEKIRIHTYDDHPATGEADLLVAFDINNIYNYKWSDLSIKLLRLDTSEMENNHFSYFLGSNYSSRRSAFSSYKNLNLIRMGGYYGEAIRSFYTYKLMLNPKYDVKTVNEFIENFMRQKNNVYYNQDYFARLKELMVKEIETLPSRTPIEKFDMHYLFYMNGHHFGSAYESSTSMPWWAPLQTKNLFELKMSTYDEFKGVRLALDLQHLLNPLLASVPYVSSYYNEARKKLKLDFNLTYKANFDSSNYKEALKRGEALNQSMLLSDREKMQENYRNLGKLRYTNMIQAFSKLMENPELCSFAGSYLTKCINDVTSNTSNGAINESIILNDLRLYCKVMHFYYLDQLTKVD